MFDIFRTDVGNRRRYGCTDSTLRLLVNQQGLWTIACYCAGNYLARHTLPPILHQMVMIPSHVWQKSVEMTTGISIPLDCTISPGPHIGHVGGIILRPGVKIGSDCNPSQGVTLGLGASKGIWGAPTLGIRVYVAPDAKVIGPVHLADGTVVGAKTVVIHSTSESDLVAGVPARVISDKGSGAYIR